MIGQTSEEIVDIAPVDTLYYAASIKLLYMSEAANAVNLFFMSSSD